MGDGVEEHLLFGRRALWRTRLPCELERHGEEHFEELWSLRPEHFHEIVQPFTGRKIALPRWQQAYGRDYRYAGSVNRALEIPPILAPLLAWCRERFDGRLNGILLNWYDAEQRHYIGAHRDSVVGLVPGTPIVTISLGATRTFRLRPMRAKGFVDFAATHGDAFGLPWASNLNLKHEVPYHAGAQGRRISVTARAFKP
jgi:alkylated DNA repair dioxygenase AlkB